MGFENGSILIKKFYYPKDFRKPEQEKRIIETRLLIKEDYAWKPLNYIWNKEQTEAILNYVRKQELARWIDNEGTERSVSYAVPNSNQYKNCRAKGENITPIGPRAALWSKIFSLALSDKNQLGYFYEKEFWRN